MDIAILNKQAPKMLFTGNKKPERLLINRTDAMGDVILALPVCGLIKKHYPGCTIIFLGRSYTRSIALASSHVDEFMNRDDWNSMSSGEITAQLKSLRIDTVIHLLPAKEVIKACWKARIKVRVGGMNKLAYWLYCNRIVPFSRKKSRLSEAELNIKLLRGIGIKEIIPRNKIHEYYGFNRIPALADSTKRLLDESKFNLIIHPLSNKNAKEWGLNNFSGLLSIIDRSKFKLFITGTEKEKEILTDWLKLHRNEITDLTGQLTADQLIAFTAASDGLIASSTGPVHIAAATGINTLGLYENRWVKRGERWGPIGKNADYLECINEDMDTISPEMVLQKILTWQKIN